MARVASRRHRKKLDVIRTTQTKTVISTVHKFHTEIRIRCRINKNTVKFEKRYPSERERV